MTNCVRLPCYFHSFVKSNLFLSLFYTWTIFFPLTSRARVLLCTRNRTKILWKSERRRVFVSFFLVYRYSFMKSVQHIYKYSSERCFVWLFVQRYSSLKLLKPMRIVHRQVQYKSTSKHRMEVNKINNVTSTTTVHIIWFQPNRVRCSSMFFFFFCLTVIHCIKTRKKQKKYKFDHIFHLF